MTTSDETTLRDFLAAYARATVAGDADAIAASYADGYVESAPSGVAVHRVDDAYRAALRERSAAMRGELGLAGAEVAVRAAREVAPGHHLVDAEWTLRFARADAAPVASTFTISYLVRLDADGPRILAYVSHEDEEAVMRRDGVL